MNASVKPQSTPLPVDDDLAQRARPGHGIPSRDPDPAAQLPLAPGEAGRESNSVLAGGLLKAEHSHAQGKAQVKVPGAAK